MEISSATGVDSYGFPGLEPYNSDGSFQGCKALQSRCVCFWELPKWSEHPIQQGMLNKDLVDLLLSFPSSKIPWARGKLGYACIPLRTLGSLPTSFSFSESKALHSHLWSVCSYCSPSPPPSGPASFTRWQQWLEKVPNSNPQLLSSTSWKPPRLCTYSADSTFHFSSLTEDDAIPWGPGSQPDSAPLTYNKRLKQSCQKSREAEANPEAANSL